VPNIFVLSDLGFGTVAVKLFCFKICRRRKQEAADISKSGFRIISIVVICGLLISTGLMIGLAEFNVLDKSIIDKNDAIWAVSILILARLLAFYVQLFEAYYRAARRASLSINLVSIQSFFNILAGFAVLFAGYGIIAYSISQLIATVVFLIGYGVYSKTLINFSKEGIVGRVKKKILKQLLVRGLVIFMSPIWQAIFSRVPHLSFALSWGQER
jgi:O-antigen/teichoic acid export membrane protein